jgi:ankyrin repeat protein
MNPNKTVLGQIKKAIKSGLDEKAYQLMYSNRTYLSKADFRVILAHASRYRDRNLYKVLMYIYNYNNSDALDVFSLDRHEFGRIVSAAGYNGNFYLLRALLTDSRCADHNFYEVFCDAMRWACKNGHIQIVRLLLNEKAMDKVWRSYTGILVDALKFAVLGQHTSIVRLLLEDGRTDLMGNGQCAIIDACEIGCIDIVRLLLEDGRSQPHAYDNMPLYMASIWGHTDIVRLLLQDDRVDPTADNCSMNVACSEGHIEIVQILMGYGRVDEYMTSSVALYKAALNGHADIVRLILENSFVSHTDPDPDTFKKICAVHPDIADLIIFARNAKK